VRRVYAHESVNLDIGMIIREGKIEIGKWKSEIQEETKDGGVRPPLRENGGNCGEGSSEERTKEHSQEWLCHEGQPRMAVEIR
jgi:hypothetical protein